MTDIPIQLVGSRGEPMGSLRVGALALVTIAEEAARHRHLAKRNALPLVLHEYLESAGYEVADSFAGKLQIKWNRVPDEAEAFCVLGRRVNLVVTLR